MKQAPTLALLAAFVILLSCGLLSSSPMTVPVPLLATAQVPPEPGHFPELWINGVDCATEQPIQVHAYNDDLFILRQSKCLNYEAPFLYLIFGEDHALLMDTGSAPDAPIAETVFRVIDQWLDRNDRDEIPLIVAHTHTHGDHFQGDPQFQGLPNVTVVGLGNGQVMQFWGFTDFPNEIVTHDLGGRVLDVLGTPGHQGQSLTLYDRRTDLLLTGDIVYPGHIFLFNQSGWNEYEQSLARLVDFARLNPISWVLGCHIEMTSTPGVPYRYGEGTHPDEHVLQLPPRILHEMLRARRSLGDQAQCAVFDDFVIHPVFVCGWSYPF